MATTNNATHENNATSNQTDSTAVEATAGQQDQQQPQQQQAPQGRWSMIKGFATRLFIIYLISSFFRRGQQPAEDVKGGAAPTVSNPQARNLFEKNSMLDMYVYLSETETYSQFDNEQLFWLKKGVRYGDWESGPNRDGCHEFQGQIHASEDLQNNGSIFIHIFVVPEGASPNPKDKKKHFSTMTIHKFRRLNKFKKRKYHKNVNLLTGQSEVHPDLIRKNDSIDFEILSHWHPNLTINLLDDHTPWTKGHIPQPLDEYIQFTADNRNYYPVVYFNDYWNLNSDFTPINETTKTLNLTLTFGPLSLFRWQMYAAQGMRNKWMAVLGDMGDNADDEDQDTLKTAILETNPYLLAVTIIVSIIHSVFEFLAFKNDIQFWRSRKSLEGLSVRSVFFNVFQSAVVVLYVLDHETNFVVKISVCVGLLIELWKIFKVIDVKIIREERMLGILPKIVIKDKSTYTESDTKKYDMMAFRYLSWALFPLLGGYAVYSLVYNEHKGWYSFILSMLYGFLLTFGFIMMTPQLFINYKLKSVAHLPWRMLTYKFLNTFIDDIFAFVIKMPTLYRIGCFRDDIVFIVYIYQRYIYRVDPSRVNEYGVSQEMMENPSTQPTDTPASNEITAPDSPDSNQSNETELPPADKKND